ADPDAVPGHGPEGFRTRRGLGNRGEEGRGRRHQRREASFIARPMSPSILSWPDMKAVVGSRSPSRILSKTSAPAVRVVSAGASIALTSAPSMWTEPSSAITNRTEPGRDLPFIRFDRAVTALH